MSQETPWGRFPDRERHASFGHAYDRLVGQKKADADTAIAHAAGKMNDLLGHAFLQPVLCPGLQKDTAEVVDRATRTILAMGVFRLSIAGRLGSQRTELAAGLDFAADEVEEKAIALAINRLARTCPAVGEVRPHSAAAFQVLLNRLCREHGNGCWEVAKEVRDAADALDLSIEKGLQAGVFIAIVTRQHEQRRALHGRLVELSKAHGVAMEELVALWLLSLKGLGRLFGEFDQTMAYAD